MDSYEEKEVIRMLSNIESMLEKFTSDNKNNPSYCCFGVKHDCPLNVNDGYCAAAKCQYKVQQDNGCV